jgi:enterobactin synthetase component D / holo-[acyl-carrier protein] synthase
VIEQIVPTEVVAVEEFGDRADATLFPEEEAVVARAVEKRRRSFATARACAREALAELGFPPTPILPGTRGAPVWPPGVAGSITHCSGYRACAVGRLRDVAALGIDAEPNEELPEGVLRRIARPEEARSVNDLMAADPAIRWDRLLFCAKESVYKTWFPLTGRWLGFDDAEISLDERSGTFAARLLVPGPIVGRTRVDGFAGRWLAGDGLVVTAIVVPAAQ